jgi:hypothetical protein
MKGMEISQICKWGPAVSRTIPEIEKLENISTRTPPMAFSPFLDKPGEKVGQEALEGGHDDDAVPKPDNRADTNGSRETKKCG